MPKNTTKMNGKSKLKKTGEKKVEEKPITCTNDIGSQLEVDMMALFFLSLSLTLCSV